MPSNNLTFENTPFSQLIKKCNELAQLRREHASLPEENRRFAADYNYHSSIASQMFNKTLGLKDDGVFPWPEEVVALAIDPKYAPAILTVGSYEYIYGRINEAMKLFLTLPTLSEDTEELTEIIDKAGDFLIDNQDYNNALTLYSTAIREHPNIALYYNGLGYCFGKLGRREEAIEQARHSVRLEPDNHEYLTDLGWSLIEANYFEEAKAVLEQAVEISPSNYKLAKDNLKELHRRLKNNL